ncbi:Centrosomal protein 135kDa [Pleodorina starrii]|nr:Centrosomal protein 135kDa [Pleodorina starrii]
MRLELERVGSQTDVWQRTSAMLQEQLATARQQLAATESRISGRAGAVRAGAAAAALRGTGGAGAEGTQGGVAAARDRTLTESRLTAGDLASLRDQLAVESSSAEEAGSTVRHMAARLAAAEAAAAAAAARGRKEESRAQGHEWVERARRVEALVAELEADVAQAINWTSREDGLLLLGVHLHGMGHWDKVAADEARSADRGLADKLAE